MTRSILHKPLFGADLYVIYSQLALEMKGQLTEANTLSLKFHDWNILLGTDTDNHAIHVKAYFHNPNRLRLKIRSGDILMRGYTRLLRLQNIRAENLPRHFIVKGKPEQSVKEILSPKFCDALKQSPRGQLIIHDPTDVLIPDDMAELIFGASRRSVTKESIKALISLFKLTLLQIYALNHPQRPPLQAHDVPMLHALKDTLETQLSAFTPVVERHGDGLQAPVQLAWGTPLQGIVSTSAPQYPLREVTLVLRASIPNASASFSLQTLHTLSALLLNEPLIEVAKQTIKSSRQKLGRQKMGHAFIDKVCAIEGDAQHYRSLADPLATLLSLSKRHVELAIEGEQLEIKFTPTVDRAVQALELFEVLWKKVATIASE